MIIRRTLMVFAAWVFVFGNAFAKPIDISLEQLRDLKAERKELEVQIKKLDNINKQIAVAQAEKYSSKALIRQQEAESRDALAELEQLQKFDRERPGAITQATLNAARDRNSQAFKALNDAKDYAINADAKIYSFRSKAGEEYAEYQRVRATFERDVSRVVDVRVDEQIHQLQISKEVEVTERVSCGDDSVPVCKERSKKAAEMKAAEQGSAVFVSSFTEVKNFQLSKEELRSEVQATLTGKVFSNQRFVGEADYETTLKATVVPEISDRLREQLAASVRSEVYALAGGKIDYSRVKDPAQHAGNAQENADDEEALPVKPAKRKKNKVVQQEEETDQDAQQEEDARREEAARQDEARREAARREEARRKAAKPKAKFLPTF